MFTSKEYLHTRLGVDPEIAAFFVDRKVPANNLYWKGRYLYVASGTGYTFIPVFFDLQHKLGISKKVLLDPLHVEVCEAGLHSAALYELQTITFTQHVENVKLLLSPYIKNQKLFEDLCGYFKLEELKPYKYLGTFSKALNRADSYLFTLTMLEATPLQVEGRLPTRAGEGLLPQAEAVHLRRQSAAIVQRARHGSVAALLNGRIPRRACPPH